MSERSAAPWAGPLLTVENLSRHYHRDGFLGRGTAVRAVDGVDLAVARGEVLALVGESGSGKSTLTRCALGLERPTSGRVLFEGEDIARTRGRRRRRFRRGVQPIFQDPYSSLDPRWTVERSVQESLDAQGIGTAAERERRVHEVLDHVGLPARFATRLPDELSGGQRQRVCIAAALASDPQLLIADEPVTALDVSVQAQVLNLLREIQRDLGLTILLVSHDLAVVSHVADRVAVMYLGKIVETGPKEPLFAAPRHPYTQALLAASPRPDPDRRLAADAVRGELSTAAPGFGCNFRPRCPYAIAECATAIPPLVETEASHKAACHVLPEPPASARAA
jgi:oligopeptide/dipeptide ABC transporter ATP-binding protein